MIAESSKSIFRQAIRSFFSYAIIPNDLTLDTTGIIGQKISSHKDVDCMTVPTMLPWERCRNTDQLQLLKGLPVTYPCTSVSTLSNFCRNWSNAKGCELMKISYRKRKWYLGHGVLYNEHFEILLLATVDVYNASSRTKKATNKFLRWQNPVLHINPIVLSDKSYLWLRNLLLEGAFTEPLLVWYIAFRPSCIRTIDHKRALQISFKFGIPEDIAMPIGLPELGVPAGDELREAMQAGLGNLLSVVV